MSDPPRSLGPVNEAMGDRGHEPATDAAASGGLIEGVQPGPATMRTFTAVLVNTLVANVTSSFLWFALTFWAYLQTRSVLVTSIIGGSFMLLVALCGTFFGTLVDRHRKHVSMLVSSVVTLISFVLAAVLYAGLGPERLSDLGRPELWLFTGVILIGAVVESLRNIALSTTVTLLVPVSQRERANGAVGAVQGLAFMVTSVFSGLAIGFLGMGWTLVIAVALTAVSVVHLLTISIPERQPRPSAGHEGSGGHLAVAWRAIRSVPGLLALIAFTTFNNLVGGVYMALMDPYGLTLFSVQLWGIVLGITSVGFLIGGAAVARFGLGGRPLRALLLVNVVVAIIGGLFAIRESAWLYAIGIGIYMCFIPVAEAAEQTILQSVVSLETQGRVFGLAQSVEAAASPISAYLIGPLAQFVLIPWMDSDAGRGALGWLLGTGQARGIALVFLVASLVMLVVVLLAFASRSYRVLTAEVARAQLAGAEPAH